MARFRYAFNDFCAAEDGVWESFQRMVDPGRAVYYFGTVEDDGSLAQRHQQYQAQMQQARFPSPNSTHHKNDFWRPLISDAFVARSECNRRTFV